MQTDPNIHFEANSLDEPVLGGADESGTEDIPAPRLRTNKQSGMDARKRKLLEIPMV